MKARLLMASIAMTMCFSLLSLAQNPRMLSNDDQGNDTLPRYNAAGVLIGVSVNAVVTGSTPAIYLTREDDTLRRINADNTITRVVKVGSGITPAGNVSLAQPTDCGGTLYFTGPTHTNWNARAPYVSTGTAAGTTLLTGTFAQAFIQVGSNVYYTTYTNNLKSGRTTYTLNVTNGTAAGTKALKNMPYMFYWQLITLNNALYYFGSDGVNTGLWRSTGTAKGTTFIARTSAIVNSVGVSISPVGLYYQNWTRPVVAGGKIYFPGDDAQHGSELWVSDGTTAGTYMLSEINPGTAGSYPSQFAATNEYLYFQADNGVSGRELFRLHFASGQVAQVADIEQGPAGSEPAHLTRFGVHIVFTAVTMAGGRDLYIYNEATNELLDVNINTSGSAFSPLNSTADNPSAFGWSFIPLQGQLYFRAKEDVYGSELWRTDGTITGTTRVTDIHAGAEHTFPSNLTVFNNKLYFRAHDATHGREWWVYDPSQPFSKSVTEEGAITDVSLSACVPNPFAESTTISYTIGRELPVRLEVLNITGQVIAVLEDAVRSAGVYTIMFDGRPHASGVFFCRLTAGSDQRTVKLVLVK